MQPQYAVYTIQKQCGLGLGLVIACLHDQSTSAVDNALARLYRHLHQGSSSHAVPCTHPHPQGRKMDTRLFKSTDTYIGPTIAISSGSKDAGSDRAAKFDFHSLNLK